MRFNERKYDEKSIKNVVISLYKIDLVNYKGYEIVKIYDDSGNYYSNFKTEFDRLNIDISKLDKGSMLSIDYVENKCDSRYRKRPFMNFVNVQVVDDLDSAVKMVFGN